jgi:hypothetical protein
VTSIIFLGIGVKKEKVGILLSEETILIDIDSQNFRYEFWLLSRSYR